MNWLHWSLLSALFAAVTAILAKAGVAHVDAVERWLPPGRSCWR